VLCEADDEEAKYSRLPASRQQRTLSLALMMTVPISSLATGWWSREDGAVAVGIGESCKPAAFASMPVSHCVPWLRFRFPLIEPDVRISRIRLSDWISREGLTRCTQTQSADLSDPKLL
jgi:hypothetical protein